MQLLLTLHFKDILNLYSIINNAFLTLTFGSPLKSRATIIPLAFSLYSIANFTVSMASSGPSFRFMAGINLKPKQINNEASLKLFFK